MFQYYYVLDNSYLFTCHLLLTPLHCPLGKAFLTLACLLSPTWHFPSLTWCCNWAWVRARAFVPSHLREELVKEKRRCGVECEGKHVKVRFFSVTVWDRVDSDYQAS